MKKPKYTHGTTDCGAGRGLREVVCDVRFAQYKRCYPAGIELPSSQIRIAIELIDAPEVGSWRRLDYSTDNYARAAVCCVGIYSGGGEYWGRGAYYIQHVLVP